MRSSCMGLIGVRIQSISHRIVLLMVPSLLLATTTPAHADNQPPGVKINYIRCCDDDGGTTCGAAGCNLDGNFYATWNSATCAPDCYMTVLPGMDDTGCDFDLNGTFRFVRRSAACTDDVGTPFSFLFTLNSPFLVTNAELTDILGADIMMEVDLTEPGAKAALRPKKYVPANPSSVPAASTWGLLAFGVMLLSAATISIRRRCA